MNFLLLCRASEASFQAERKNVVLPPLLAVTAAQRAPNSTQKRLRTETDNLDLPATDNPARNQEPSTGKWRKITGNNARASPWISRRADRRIPATHTCCVIIFRNILSDK